MRHYTYIIIAIAALLASCTKQGTPPPEEDMLYRVEGFYLDHWDSAQCILDTLNIAVLSPKEQAHYCLLRAKVNDGLRQYDDIDSLVEVAQKQFIGGKDKYFEAMTYMLLSRVAQKKHLGDQCVLDYRLKALQSIEQCHHVDERLIRFSPTPTDEQNEIDRVKYALHQRIGMSYTANGYYKEGIEHLGLTEKHYEAKQNLRLHTASAYMLAYAYLACESYDSTLLYLEKGFASAKALGDVEQRAYYHNAMANLHLTCFAAQRYSNEEGRQELLLKSVEECQQGLSDLESLNEKAAITFQQSLYEELAHAYLELHQYDSCIHYAQLGLSASKNRNPHDLSLYEWLYEAYKAKGDDKDALLYADYLVKREDQTDMVQKAVADVKMDYDQQMEVQRIESEQRLKRAHLYLLIALLALALLSVWYFATRYTKNKELEVLKLRDAQHQLQLELTQANAHQKATLQQRAMAIFLSKSDDKLPRIIAEFEATYPNTIEKLKDTFPLLTKTEYHLVVLSFLGFRAKEEAELLGLTENTALKYRSNIRKKAGNDPLLGLVEPEKPE